MYELLIVLCKLSETVFCRFIEICQLIPLTQQTRLCLKTQYLKIGISIQYNNTNSMLLSAQVSSLHKHKRNRLALFFTRTYPLCRNPFPKRLIITILCNKIMIIIKTRKKNILKQWITIQVQCYVITQTTKMIEQI